MLFTCVMRLKTMHLVSILWLKHSSPLPLSCFLNATKTLTCGPFPALSHTYKSSMYLMTHYQFGGNITSVQIGGRLLRPVVNNQKYVIWPVTSSSKPLITWPFLLPQPRDQKTQFWQSFLLKLHLTNYLNLTGVYCVKIILRYTYLSVSSNISEARNICLPSRYLKLNEQRWTQFQ